ncbi:virulence RhuM family protein [Candidatus Nitrotoga sp. M5]|uniref:virulence RhuM family protein n=1 Tax=Candidatus Nitrotoga sp. M5 TaxID=2890409 RepID=UPI001EF20CFA|nr:virulence RhuM family protein [Candidatus Nitrotoga sp. M5]CAH1385616.1 hypothetical protein NTGM5_140010 [Candidatus Nitrotoga sp. M5]
MHIEKVFADSELEEDSVLLNFRITAADGKSHNTKLYFEEQLQHIREIRPSER